MSEEINREEAKKRKQEIINRIYCIDKMLFNPENFHLDLNGIKKLETERKCLMEEYKLLPPEEVVIEDEVVKNVSYVGYGGYVVKESTNGKLGLYSGGEFIAPAEFLDDQTLEARKKIVSIDTMGYPVEYVYRFRIVEEFSKEESAGEPVKLKFTDRIRCSNCGSDNLEEALKITGNKCVFCRKNIKNES